MQEYLIIYLALSIIITFLFFILKNQGNTDDKIQEVKSALTSEIKNVTDTLGEEIEIVRKENRETSQNVINELRHIQLLSTCACKKG